MRGFKNKLKQGGHVLSHSATKVSYQGDVSFGGSRVSTALREKVDASKGGKMVTRDNFVSGGAGCYIHQLFQELLGSHRSLLVCLYVLILT